MSISFSKKIFSSSLTAFILIIFSSANSLAWDGYDYDNDTAIEINSGNFVREGNVIDIYDWRKGENHKFEVKLMEEMFNSTRIEGYDLDEQKNRVLEMEK